MIGMDDSKSNRHIVEMIKKIALAIESKNTTELREIAEELEAWQPRENWEDMDVRTKVFVEHVLVGLARIQLGMDVLDQGAHELGEIREKLERTLDELDKEDKYSSKLSNLKAGIIIGELLSKTFTQRSPPKIQERRFLAQVSLSIQ